jgi:hypothetical protein
MFPKRKLCIIVWKLCQVSFRNRNPLPTATKSSLPGIVNSGLTYQRYNLVLPLVGGLEFYCMKGEAHEHFNP